MIFLNFLFCVTTVFAGLTVKTEISQYTVHSFDNARIILQSTDTKQKWDLSRSHWFAGQQPTVGKKIFLAGSIKKQLTPHRH